ncbi:MAG TPA: hypothetical protein VIG84_05030 [Brevundimonas sp.]
MTRYKGMSSKQVLDAHDLAELDDIYRPLHRLHGQLNPVSCQRFPLMAASATVKAAWTDLSGTGSSWSYPYEGMARAIARSKSVLGPPDSTTG